MGKALLFSAHLRVSLAMNLLLVRVFLLTVERAPTLAADRLTLA